jgi:hypothetical protein
MKIILTWLTVFTVVLAVSDRLLVDVAWAQNQFPLPKIEKLNKILVLTRDYSPLARGSSFAFKFFGVDNKAYTTPTSPHFYLLLGYTATQAIIKSKGSQERQDLQTFSRYKNFTVVVYPDLRTAIPEASSERKKIADFFDGLPVVFDDEENLVFEVERGSGLSQSDVSGLYFVRAGKVEVRYSATLGAYTAQGFLDEINQQMQRFNANQKLELLPFEIGRIGAVIPSSVLQPGKVSLVLRVSLQKGQVKDFSNLNSINQNLLLERLPKLLAKYPVRFVGVVNLDRSLLPELEQAYPKWDYLPMFSAQERVQWFELFAAVLDKQNKVVGHFLLLYNEQQDNFASVENLIQTALR